MEKAIGLVLGYALPLITPPKSIKSHASLEGREAACKKAFEALKAGAKLIGPALAWFIHILQVMKYHCDGDWLKRVVKFLWNTTPSMLIQEFKAKVKPDGVSEAHSCYNTIMSRLKVRRECLLCLY
jgi:hypothetical protein